LKRIVFFGLLAAIAGLLVYVFLHRNDWRIPENAKGLRNPLVPSNAALRSAAGIYKAKCAECHGETGKGDGPDAAMYEPAPADLTDARRIGGRTDGELFYQISEGRKPMPAFRDKLTAEQRWQLVMLVRSFAGK